VSIQADYEGFVTFSKYEDTYVFWGNSEGRSMPIV
jgi:hypothetical protein